MTLDNENWQKIVRLLTQARDDELIELDKPYLIDDYKISFLYTKDSTTATHFVISKWNKTE